jgi:malonyl-CoA O-methyltransferase
MGMSRRRAHDKIIEIVTEEGKTGRILDAPAGAGAISKRLREAGFEVYAADIAPEVFEPPDIRCEKVDLNHDLPYEDESFDYILSSSGFEYLEDQYNFVRDCYRILKPKGRFLRAVALTGFFAIHVIVTII